MKCCIVLEPTPPSPAQSEGITTPTTVEEGLKQRLAAFQVIMCAKQRKIFVALAKSVV
jgi:hypothetical protein